MKRGDGTKSAVCQSNPHWAQYEIQFMSRSDDTHRLSKESWWRGKPVHSDRLDVGTLSPTCSEKLDGDASSRRRPDLKNNDTCCSMDKLVSKQQVTHTAPLPAISMRDSPHSPQPTLPHTLYRSSYGPQMAVTSIHLRFHRESHCHRLDGTELRQNDEAYCSGTKTISK